MSNMTKAEAEQADLSRPLPLIDADSAPFWAGCKEGELRIPQCSACGHRFMPPRSICPKCHHQEIDFLPVEPRGTVYTTITFHHAFHPAFKTEVPYNCSLIELSSGVRLWSQVVGCDPSEVSIGAEVEATFEKLTDEITLPQFRLVKGA